jgi:uncharacterized protein
MPINDDVVKQIKQAMRNKEVVRLRALRGMRAAFIAAMKETGADELTDQVCLTELKRLAKQRKESIAAYVSGGRPELAAEEQEELDVISVYLPKLADLETTKAWAQEAITATGASGMADMGKVMGHLMKNHKSDLDGKLANQIVGQLLRG